MDIYVTGPRAFALIRESRTGGTARLQPAPGAQAGTGTGQLPPAERLSIVAPKAFADISERRPLDLTYADKAERRRSRLVRPHYGKASVPGSSSRLAVPAGVLRSAGLPSDLRIFADSPAQAFLNAAETLSRLQGTGSVDHTSAVLRLISLGSELCGSYSRDPLRPHGADVTYKIAPASSAEEIRSYLHLHDRVRGIALAREAAAHLTDGLASPLECAFYYAIALQPRLGGASFPKPLINKPLVAPSPEEGALSDDFAFTHNSRITPDLQWPLSSLGIAVEVDGFVFHSDKQAFNTDRLRDQDCLQRGYQVIHVTHENLASVESLERILALLIDKAADRLPRSRVANLRRNLANPKASERRATLIAILG